MLNFIVILLVFIATIIGAFGSLYFKKAAKQFNLNLIQQVKNKNLIIGAVLFCTSTIIYLFALKKGNLSLVYPLTALSYTWIALISIKFLGEKMNQHKWLGIALIILGIVMVTYFAA